jgi:hypothetical protein
MKKTTSAAYLDKVTFIRLYFWKIVSYYRNTTNMCFFAQN